MNGLIGRGSEQFPIDVDTLTAGELLVLIEAHQLDLVFIEAGVDPADVSAEQILTALNGVAIAAREAGQGTTLDELLELPWQAAMQAIGALGTVLAMFEASLN